MGELSIARGISRIPGKTSNDNYGYNAITLGGSEDALTLTIGRGRVYNTLNSATGIGVGTTMTYTDSVSFTITIQKGVEYTLSVTGATQAMTPTLTWTASDLTVKTETLASYNGNMNGNAALTYVVNTQMIPEPATATLSLLALAGLAARRRRK